MSHDCACTRPITDTAVVCPHCGHILDAALAEVVDWLAAELDVTLAKQTRIAAGHSAPQPEEPQAKAPGTLKPNPLPYHGGASRAAGDLKAALVSWARLIHAEAGADLPADDLTSIAAWMRPRVGWLRYHEAGQDAVDEISTAVGQARRVVDRPAEHLYAGPCDCGTDLYAWPEASYVECRNEECDAVWEVEARRIWMRSQLQDLIGGASYVAAICTGLGVKVSPSAIRMWVKRHKLRPLNYTPSLKEKDDPDGKPRPLYRVGDVIRVAAGEDLYATTRKAASR